MLKTPQINTAKIAIPGLDEIAWIKKVNILKSHSQSIAYVAVYSQNKGEKLFFGENFETGPKSALHQALDTHPGKVETQSLSYEGKELHYIDEEYNLDFKLGHHKESIFVFIGASGFVRFNTPNEGELFLRSLFLGSTTFRKEE